MSIALLDTRDAGSTIDALLDAVAAGSAEPGACGVLADCLEECGRDAFAAGVRAAAPKDVASVLQACGRRPCRLCNPEWYAFSCLCCAGRRHVPGPSPVVTLRDLFLRHAVRAACYAEAFGPFPHEPTHLMLSRGGRSVSAGVTASVTDEAVTWQWPDGIDGRVLRDAGMARPGEGTAAMQLGILRLTPDERTLLYASKVSVPTGDRVMRVLTQYSITLR